MLYRWASETGKFVFMKRVDKGRITTEIQNPKSKSHGGNSTFFNTFDKTKFNTTNSLVGLTTETVTRGEVVGKAQIRNMWEV